MREKSINSRNADEMTFSYPTLFSFLIFEYIKYTLILNIHSIPIWLSTILKFKSL